MNDMIESAVEWDVRAVQRNPEKAAEYIQALAAALEASVQAPAVDREALAERMFYAAGCDDWGVANDDERTEWLEQADAVFASGILQDSADTWDEGRTGFCTTDGVTVTMPRRTLTVLSRLGRATDGRVHADTPNRETTTM